MQLCVVILYIHQNYDISVKKFIILIKNLKEMLKKLFTLFHEEQKVTHLRFQDFHELYLVFL